MATPRVDFHVHLAPFEHLHPWVRERVQTFFPDAPQQAVIDRYLTRETLPLMRTLEACEARLADRPSSRPGTDVAGSARLIPPSAGRKWRTLGKAAHGDARTSPPLLPPSESQTRTMPEVNGPRAARGSACHRRSPRRVHLLRHAAALLIATLLAAAALQVAPARRAALASPEQPREVLVTAWKDALEALRTQVLRHGAPYAERLDKAADGPLAGVLRVGLQPGQGAPESARALAGTPFAARAEPNYVRHVAWLPDDPLFMSGSQWALQRVGAEQAWDLAPRRGRGVTVALIDTGIDARHEEFQRPGAVSGLSKNVLTGGDGPAAVSDDNGHGTALAGVVAAAANNGRGMAGLAPQATILAVKALSAAGQGDDAAIASGIVHAVRSGARVINLSLGGPQYSRTLQDAITYALERDAVVVAAAGNHGTPTPTYPAAYEGVVAVGAVDMQDRRAPFSGYGRPLSLVAPGIAVMTTATGDRYRSESGTSFAAALVSAGVALLLGEHPDRSRTAVVQSLTAQAERRGSAEWNDERGFGRLEAARMLAAQESLLRITGTVRDADGMVTGATVRVIGPGGVREARSDAGGAFVVAGLPPGLYTVVAETPNGARTSVPVRRALAPGGGAYDVALLVDARPGGLGGPGVLEGHFEQEWGSWTAVGAGPAELTPAAAFDGALGVRLGSAQALPGLGDTVIASAVRVPAQRPRLTFSYRFRSYQLVPANWLEVSVVGRAGPPLFRAVSNTPREQWRHATLDLSPFAGDVVTLRFTLHAARAEPTWADLDAIAIGVGQRDLAQSTDADASAIEPEPLPPGLAGAPAPSTSYHPIVSRP